MSNPRLKYTITPDKITAKDVFDSNLETFVIMSNDDIYELAEVLADKFIRWLVKQYYVTDSLGSGVTIVKRYNIRPVILKIVKELGNFTAKERSKIIETVLDIIKR